MGLNSPFSYDDKDIAKRINKPQSKPTDKTGDKHNDKPANKIERPKGKPSSPPKNKIEPPKRKSQKEPRNKIEHPKITQNAKPKNKITPPKQNPSQTPSNKIEYPNLASKIKKNAKINSENLSSLDERFVIDCSELRNICNKIIKNNPDFKSYTAIGKALGIGSNISKALKGNLGLSKHSFSELKKLTNQEISYKIRLGSHEKIELKKNGDTSELVGITLGEGNLTNSKGNYRLDISLNIVDEPEYVDYVRNFLRKIYNLEPRVVPVNKKSTAIGNEKGVNVQLTKASVVRSLLKLGLKSGNKTQNQISVPEWIKENKENKIRCLKGLADTDGGFSLQRNSIRFIFTNASKPLVNDFRSMCNSLNIRTGITRGPYTYKDLRTGNVYKRYSVAINAKDEVKKFINHIKPLKWKIQYKKLGRSLQKQNPNKSIPEIITGAFNLQRNYYSIDYAEKLKDLVLRKGSYNEVVKYIKSRNNERVPPREIIAKYMKRLFNEPKYRDKYGVDGYNLWHKYNSNVLISLENKKIKRFSLDIKKSIISEIVKIKNQNKYIDKTRLLKELKSVVNNKDLNGKIIKKGSLTNVIEPAVLKFERLSYLWNKKEFVKQIDDYILQLTDLYEDVLKYNKSNKNIVLTRIHEKYKELGEQKTIKMLISHIFSLIIRENR